MLIQGFNQGQVATQRLTIKYVLATLRPQADCARYFLYNNCLFLGTCGNYNLDAD